MISIYKIIDTIRQDSLVETFKVLNPNNSLFILKNYKGSNGIQEDNSENFVDLLNSLSRINYPSILIIASYNLNYENNLLYPQIINEYLPIGSLQNIFDSGSSFDQTDKYITILGIALGVNFLHSYSIIHGNLKPSNIIIDENRYPKINDICLFHENPDTYTKNYDIFCFSQIIYQIITNKRPPIEISNIQNYCNQDFFKRCISDDPEIVPSFGEILDFITKKTFRQLFTELKLNKVFEYLELFEKNEDGEAFAIHGFLLYENGNSQQKQEAFSLLKKGADLGCSNAAINFALLLTTIPNKMEEAIKYYQKEINKGNVTAMYIYACYLSRNVHSEKDQKMANELFQRAAEKGHPQACDRYALILIGLNQKEEAARFLKMAADRGNVRSMFNYAKMLETGSGIQANIEEAIKYYKSAIERGDIKSMNNYANILKESSNEEDKELALKYFKEAADCGNEYAMYNYAKMLHENEQETEADSYFLKSIQKGYTKAMIEYGKILVLRKGEDNIKEAAKLYKMAEEKNDFDVIDNIIVFIENGNEFEISDNLLNHCLKLASEGDLLAMSYCGIIFLQKKEKLKAANYFWMVIKDTLLNKNFNFDSSQTREKDAIAISHNYYLQLLKKKEIQPISEKEEENTAFFKFIADQNQMYGIVKYSLRLKNGIGTEKDEKEAFILMKKAAEMDNPKAMIECANFLKNGIGTKVDLVEAVKYYELAISKDYNPAKFMFAKFILKYLNDSYREKAMLLLKEAADSGYKKAIIKYPIEKEKENNPENLKEIMFYYKKAADIGDAYSMFKYGKYIKDKGDAYIKTAGQYLKKAAEQGIEEAEKIFLEIVEDDKFVFDDKIQMAYYMKKAAELKLPNAMYKYGLMLKNGKDVPIDKIKASEFIKEAAEKGNIDAMTEYTKEIIEKNGIVNYDYDHFAKEAEKYENILKEYNSDNSKVFVDENFPHFKNWKRLDEIYNAPLFKRDLIDPNFIMQGEIGDCYFMSSLSRVAKDKYLVSHLFETELPDRILGCVEHSINIKCGAVIVYFQAFGKRTPVLIDTYIPMNGNKPYFSKLTDDTKSPWFCLVEKAFAKLNGSFSNIIGGYSSYSIYSLFFYYSKILDLTDLMTSSNSNPFRKIMNYQKKGYLINSFIQADKKIDTDQLVVNHSYFIFKAREVDKQNFICLRNPWGEAEYQGEFSKESEKWTPKLKDVLGFDQCQNGTFFMTDHEFFSYFDQFEILKPIHPEWKRVNFKYKFAPGKSDGFPISDARAQLFSMQTFIFQMTDPHVNEKFKVHVIVEKRKSSFQDQISNKTETSYCILFGNYNGRRLDTNIFSNARLFKYCSSTKSISSFSYEVEKNSKISIVLHRLEKQDFNEDCYVSVFCKHDFIFYDIDHRNEIFPYVDNPGLLCNNFTATDPSISSPLVIKFLNDRFVFTFGNLSQSGDFKKDDISKFFHYANKKIGSSRVDLNEFIFINKVIGSGTNGKVYIVKEKKSYKQYAAKISNYEINEKKGFFRELTVLRSIKYPSIVKFRGFNEKDFGDNNYPTLITEYLENKSLSHALQDIEKSELLTPTKKMINIFGIALGMDYLHRHNIIHRDLKFSNILLDADFYPKICDFGESKLMNIETYDTKTPNIGTTLFMAPEVADSNKHYSYPVDVYSFGVIVYFIYKNELPSRTPEVIDVNSIDSRYHNFVRKLLSVEPNERPTFNGIINSLLTDKKGTWLDDVDENEVEQYLHKFGLSIKPKNNAINYDTINSINEDSYPDDAKQPKMSIQQMIESESISDNIKSGILFAEDFIEKNSCQGKEKEEIGSILFELGRVLSVQNKDTDYGIEIDLYYAIRYLKAAALCGNIYAPCYLAYIFVNDQNPRSKKIAFEAASISADLDCPLGFSYLGNFYYNGFGVKANIAMSAINFKIAADLGDVNSMIQYASILMNFGMHKLDLEELNHDIQKAEKIIQKTEGKKNYVYNETRLTIEALENEDVALYVSKRYLEKASKKGCKETDEMLLLINSTNKTFDDHPQFYDDLCLTLDCQY